MRVISMKLIKQVMKLKEENKISTKAAMDMLVDAGAYKAGELPDIESMDAIIRGIKHKRRNSNGYKSGNESA
jgi:hypothetical protein